MGIYESSDMDFLEQFVYEGDKLIGKHSALDPYFRLTTASNNKYAREVIEHLIYTIKKARNGG